jgi:hypothetical protein
LNQKPGVEIKMISLSVNIRRIRSGCKRKTNKPFVAIQIHGAVNNRWWNAIHSTNSHSASETNQEAMALLPNRWIQ